MLISGKIHCLFEQSGTFKGQFIELGYDAFDYDIQNQFGQTDFQVDLFDQINDAYCDRQSIFDTFTKDDLLLAFFPCTYFCEDNVMFFAGTNKAYRHASKLELLNSVYLRSMHRQQYYEYLLELCFIVEKSGLRLIIENPFSCNHYLHNNFPYKPAIIDKNRQLRGDHYVKPTQYYFINCEPTHGCSVSDAPKKMYIRHQAPSGQAGLCSSNRSMISATYARNFICDFILGKEQQNTMPTLFN